MKEYIEREAFIIAKRKQYCADCDRRKGVKRGKTVFCYEIGDAPCRSCGIGDVLDDVEDFPAADVVEARNGKWIEENTRPRSSQFCCPVCHRTAYDPQPTRVKDWKKRCRYAYCPNCGAKMDGGVEDASG